MTTIERLNSEYAEVASHQLAEYVAELRANEVDARASESDISIDGIAHRVPKPVRDALLDVLAHFADGKAVAISRVDELLTTTQAADLLSVSRQYVCRLVDNGTLPAEFRGTHRRIRLDDLLRYREAQKKVQGEALDRIAALSREGGLYDDDF